MAERVPFDATDPRLAAAAWSRLAEPGDAEAGGLVSRHGPVEALDRLRSGHGDERMRAAMDRWRPRLETLDIRRELEVLDRLGGTLVLPQDATWPAALDELGDRRPFALWVRGSTRITRGLAVAVVGARAATAYGEQVAADLTAGLAARSVTVVSGGAYGIDAAAHRGTLAEGGHTVAVLAGGVDRMYPAGNSALLHRITETGTVLSEVPPGSAPSRHRFLSRNRLIAALTAGTVVVEAAWRSGALSTATHATDLMRPVGAVPGPVTSMASAGCHRLLREGAAVCVTDTAEVLELVGPVGGTLPADPVVPTGLLDDLDPLSARVLDALPARGAASLEGVVRASGLARDEAIAALGLLELAGRARRSGRRWTRAR